MPPHTAIAGDYLKQSQMSGEVFANSVGRVQFEKPAFAEHKQPAGMIDLTINQDYRDDDSIANRARRICVSVLKIPSEPEFERLRESLSNRCAQMRRTAI